jgi:hypothetical protein
MKFWNVLLAGTLLGLATLPVNAKPLKDSEYFTNHSMGCMLLQECTEGVDEVFSLLDISIQYVDPERYTFAASEFNTMLMALNQVGVKVYLADEKYFPVGHRGVYHTASNNFYLNKAFMGRPNVLMSVMRHEGWHAAQDCMAGTIDNSMIAIIMDEEKVPKIWQEIATDTYRFQPSAIPWEKEAYWAGKTKGMTMEALLACSRGKMWTTYPPTPMTRDWLVKNGYLLK